ncbi:MAG: hypothetical protein ACYS26_00155 [Planctomycetota bacterium]|jgi:hypothetical protein
MTRLLAWIGLLALLSFGAGLATGILSERHARGPQEPGGPLGHYREALIEAFDLGPVRQSGLRHYLERYQEAVEEIEARGLAQYRRELTQEGRLCLDRVRNEVLAPADRERFDAWCAGRWVPGQPWPLETDDLADASEGRPAGTLATLLLPPAPDAPAGPSAARR